MPIVIEAVGVGYAVRGNPKKSPHNNTLTTSRVIIMYAQNHVPMLKSQLELTSSLCTGWDQTVTTHQGLDCIHHSTLLPCEHNNQCPSQSRLSRLANGYDAYTYSSFGSQLTPYDVRGTHRHVIGPCESSVVNSRRYPYALVAPHRFASSLLAHLELNLGD